MNPPKRNNFWRWIWIVWLILVCILSLMPGGSSLNNSMYDWPYLDKVLHGIMYAILSLTMLKFLQKSSISQPVIYVIIFCVLWGVMIEFLQNSKIINRDFDIADIIANIIGTFAGIAITKYIKF